MIFFKSLYQFLISLKLAFVLILLLIISLATGTILESRYSAATAKIIIYNSAWFSAILLMLGLNVFSVAMSRLPWKKRHIGFLLTHLGIILILTGSMITRFSMTDGQLILEEGESSGTINLTEQILKIRRMGDETVWSTPVPQKAFPWKGLEKIGSPGELPVTLFLTHFYPKALASQFFEKAETGPGLIDVTLQSSMATQELQLLEDPTGMATINLGPASVAFSHAFEESLAQQNGDEDLFLEFRFAELIVPVYLQENLLLPYEVALEDTPYKIIIESIFKNAIVVDNQVIENQNAPNIDAWTNPAVKLILKGDGLEEKHHVFANFPDFSTIHGREKPASEVKILFHVPHENTQVAQHELRFFKNEEKLMYQIKSGDALSGGEVQVHTRVPMGWMDFGFQVDRYYPHAQKLSSFIARSNASTADGVTTAIEITLNEAGEEASSVWLGLEENKDLLIGKNTYRVFFGRKEKNIGFVLKLLNFKKENYPGTDKPASFSSDVELIDTMRGVRKSLTISMNEPLEYRGYKIYQSAYRQRPGQKDISIFSVGRDPGVPLNYLGAIVLVSGIVTMIFMQKPKNKKMKGL